MGLVEAPGQLLSENEWQSAKERSNQRDDSRHPCVICKEDFGLQEQVCLFLLMNSSNKKHCR